jgi:hypothetical protein
LFRSSDASYPSLRTHTANLRAVAGFRRLVEVPLPLELFFADAMRFIPVQFSEPHSTVPQSYPRRPFHFPPIPFAIQPAEAATITA